MCSRCENNVNFLTRQGRKEAFLAEGVSTRHIILSRKLVLNWQQVFPT